MTSVSNARKLATWHAIALISDALTVTIVDTLQQIALTKYHLQAHQQDAGTTTLVGMTDQHLGVITTPGITNVTIGIGTDSVDLDLTPITLDIGVTVTVILAEVTLDPFTDPCIVAHYATEAQAHTATAETHHTTDPHHAGISPEMTVDPEHAQFQQTPLQNLTETIFQFTSNTLEAQQIGSTNRLQLITHPHSIIALMNRTVIQRMI